MKTFAKMYFAIVLSFAVLWGSAAAQPFIHPGILHNRAELDFIKDKIKAGAEPWKTRWEKMRAATASELTMKPRPFEKVNRGGVWQSIHWLQRNDRRLRGGLFAGDPVDHGPTIRPMPTKPLKS